MFFDPEQLTCDPGIHIGVVSSVTSILVIVGDNTYKIEK